MTNKKSSSHKSVEVKLKAVLQVIENKRPVAEVANELHLHRDTVNRWVKAFKVNGKQGLENARSTIQNNSHLRESTLFIKGLMALKGLQNI